MFTPELRRRLSEIARGKAQVAVGPPQPAQDAADYILDIEFEGREERNYLSRFVVFTYRIADVLPEVGPIAASACAAAAALGRDPSRLLYMDLETCGLASVPLFLVGTMRVVEDDFEVTQLFARNYSEEKGVLWQVREIAAGVEGIITFNGKAFDVPFLRDRMAFHKLEFSPPRVHYDLLHDARRRWGRSLPNCRLQTLEVLICRKNRSGDIPGSEIPGLYHEYVRTGEIGPLIPVFKHNAMDLLTMAELLPEVKR
jgi:uncharacterized protein YprB with RNaseH-like and TPR domain